MGFISSAFYFFAPYTDASERTVALFFKSLTEHSGQSQTRARLDDLLQHNIAVINLWTEYRYKGYKYLSKPQRRELYANLQLIAEDFDRFCARYTPSADEVMARIRERAPHAVVEPDKAIRLQALMDYFSPQRGMYEYRESSSFGRLLRDPSHEKLTGDCNQIVTLYIYLYSHYHDIRDLQVRVLPGHVALHYGGIDIEATNGTFASYHEEKGNRLLPVEEIVSINLLDTTDSYLSTHEVAAEDFLQASRFAFILSHDRNIVRQNLAAAYGRLVDSLMKRHNYSDALKFALASGNTALLDIVGHNGAIYEIEHHNYAAARRYAWHAPKRDELIQSSWQSEGAQRYQAHRYHDAIKAFEHVGDQQSIHRCYEALFFEEQEKLGSNLTAESIKAKASVISRMLGYAKKSGNKKLIEYADSLNRHL